MPAELARIMIIDDEERIRTLLLDFFEDYDEFSLRACETAESALEELKREKADLCIVDVRLPGMDGQSFIIEAMRLGLACHFILHTGSTDFTLSEELRRSGFHDKDVFLKPCNMGDMLARIRELIAANGASA